LNTPESYLFRVDFPCSFLKNIQLIFVKFYMTSEISSENKSNIIKALIFLIIFPPLSVYFLVQIQDIRSNNEIQDMYINRRINKKNLWIYSSIILTFLGYWPGFLCALLLFVDRWKVHKANSKRYT
jgi:uncharacterized membrane protein YqaE (UPF0057 family)